MRGFYAILVALSSLSFLCNENCVQENRYTFADNEGINETVVENSHCAQTIKEKIDFSFGDGMIVDDSFEFTVTTNIVDIKDISTDGDIDFEIVSIAGSCCTINAYLPEDDGQATITFYDGKSSYTRTLFSSMNDEGEYAISSLSLYSAWKLLNKLPLQEHMDGDLIESSDQGQTPEEENNSNAAAHRVIASGKVFGTLLWTDDADNVHPLAGVKVKLTFSGSWGDASTYTNSSGYFSISFSNMWTVSSYQCFIHVYAESEMIKVVDNDGTLYEMVESLSGMENGQNYNYSTYTFSVSQNDDLGRAMSIFSAGNEFAKYAKSLNGGSSIQQCTIIYPASNEDETYYSNGGNTIHLGKSSKTNTNGGSYPNPHASWDSIGHEYGHHLQYYNFRQEYYGKHYYDCNDIYGYFHTKEENATDKGTSYTIDDTEITNAKTQALGLAWKEAWPTFFSISAQSAFPNNLKTIPTVGDYLYTSSNGVQQNLKSTINTAAIEEGSANGETDETILMSFLYRLWDSENSLSFDNISISDQDLWNIMVSKNPERFYDFIDDLANSGLSFDVNDLGALLEGFKISASELTIENYSDNYADRPKFIWNKNGFDVIFKSKTYAYSNDKFILEFYDEHKYLIASSSEIRASSYIPTQAIWNSILAAQGTNYYVVIKSYSTLGVTSGPYFSQYYEFSKPSKAEQTLNINNVRYYEKTVAIAEGTNWTFDISFDTSGTKLIQTFGTSDTKMWIYASDGTTLLEVDDDDGCSTNSLIYRYFEKGVKYILKLAMYSSSVSGETKLSIAPIYGVKSDDATEINSFENFMNINTYTTYTWTSYLATNYSKMVTWTVPETGTYKISLTSDYDNYLYVINPLSSTENVWNVDYNDDSDGINASLTRAYEKNKKYAIFYCQYSPKNEIGTNSVDSKIVLKIEKQ